MFIATWLRETLTSEGLFECQWDFEAEIAFITGVIRTRPISGHLSSRLIRRLFSDLPVVTCLRHPVDRVLSQYFYWRNDFSGEIWCDSTARERFVIDKEADPWKDFMRCLEDDRLYIYSALRNLQAYQLADHPYDRKLSETETYKSALNWLNTADVVGVTEQLSVFVDDICAFFRIDQPLFDRAKRINMTGERPALEDMPSEVRAAVERHNRIDIAIYEEVRRQLESGARHRHSPRSFSVGADHTIPPLMPSTCVGKKSAVKDPSNFWDRPEFVDIPGWTSRTRGDLFYHLCSLQSAAADAGSIVEFRPEFGLQLATLGAIARATRRIIGIGFEDDGPLYPPFLGSYRRCTENLRRFLPGRSVSLVHSKADASKTLEEDGGGLIRAGLVSRPFQAADVTEELILLDKYLADDGYVYVDCVYNQRWPHVSEGLYRYLANETRGLVPAIIVDQGVIMFRTQYSYYFTELLLNFPQYRRRYLTKLFGYEGWGIISEGVTDRAQQNTHT